MQYILMMAGPAGEGGQQPGNPLMNFLPILIMFALLYFLMIMPQQKRQKEMQKMLDSLQVNDKVVTSSGILGRVVTIKPDKNTIMVEIDETNHVRVEFQRGAVVEVIRPEGSPKA
ncbi:MAG: preprotein translocase subunit YajC [Candidatus Cloacimonetes bacterium]|nr:preprotein translocase subunit YajC [Candidatus Cloacimonadota bacterium]